MASEPDAPGSPSMGVTPVGAEVDGVGDGRALRRLRFVSIWIAAATIAAVVVSFLPKEPQREFMVDVDDKGGARLVVDVEAGRFHPTVVSAMFGAHFPPEEVERRCAVLRDRVSITSSRGAPRDLRLLPDPPSGSWLAPTDDGRHVLAPLGEFECRDAPVEVTVTLSPSNDASERRGLEKLHVDRVVHRRFCVFVARSARGHFFATAIAAVASAIFAHLTLWRSPSTASRPLRPRRPWLVAAAFCIVASTVTAATVPRVRLRSCLAVYAPAVYVISAAACFVAAGRAAGLKADGSRGTER